MTNVVLAFVAVVAVLGVAVIVHTISSNSMQKKLKGKKDDK